MKCVLFGQRSQNTSKLNAGTEREVKKPKIRKKLNESWLLISGVEN